MKQIVALFCFLFLSCNIGNNPGSRAFIGKWKGSNGAQLNFYEDSTFIGVSLSQKMFFKNGNISDTLSFNGTGHWHISEWKFQFPTIVINFDSTNILKTTTTNLFVSGNGFFENNPPWQRLFIWVGEEGEERYEFVR